jgi:hypothetical protein
MQPVSGQRLGKDVPTRNNIRGCVFYVICATQHYRAAFYMVSATQRNRAVFSVRGPCREDIRFSAVQFSSVQNYSRVEAGSNTSTVALRVVGGDGKGSLESETIKYGLQFYGTRTRE